ncbi:DUF3667 domain-containing protein [Mucilaginibacter sp.]
MKKHYRKEDDCLNCGFKLQGKFCYNCGQENLQMKESFGHMMNHAISDYFHFDDQFFSTIKPLFLKPGFLSNEYMAGRRIRYLHPVKMYIFISLVYFVLLFQTSFKPAKIADNGEKHVSKKTLVNTNKKLDSVLKDPDMPALGKNFIIDAKKQNEKALAKGDTTDDDNDDLRSDDKGYRLPGSTHDTSYTEYLSDQQKLLPKERDGFLGKMYNKKALAYRKEYGSRTKEVIYDEFKHNVPKMMFLMLPLCALIFQIAFWNNKKFYVEHLIYTFHLHCFLFLFLSIIMLLEIILPTSWGLSDWLTTIATIGIIWYLYKSMRVFYHRSPFRTITKLIGISFVYSIVFAFCIAFVFVLTALML